MPLMSTQEYLELCNLARLGCVFLMALCATCMLTTWLIKRNRRKFRRNRRWPSSLKGEVSLKANLPLAGGTGWRRSYSELNRVR
jgi:hypothetical protein